MLKELYQLGLKEAEAPQGEGGGVLAPMNHFGKEAGPGNYSAAKVGPFSRKGRQTQGGKPAPGEGGANSWDKTSAREEM